VSRYASNDDWLYLYLTNGGLYLTQKVNNVWSSLVTGGPTIAQGVWYDVRVVCLDQRVQVYHRQRESENPMTLVLDTNND
jgi:hypothetical protein